MWGGSLHSDWVGHLGIAPVHRSHLYLLHDCGECPPPRRHLHPISLPAGWGTCASPCPLGGGHPEGLLPSLLFLPAKEACIPAGPQFPHLNSEK